MHISPSCRFDRLFPQKVGTKTPALGKIFITGRPAGRGPTDSSSGLSGLGRGIRTQLDSFERCHLAADPAALTRRAPWWGHRHQVGIPCSGNVRTGTPDRHRASVGTRNGGSGHRLDTTLGRHAASPHNPLNLRQSAMRKGCGSGSILAVCSLIKAPVPSPMTRWAAMCRCRSTRWRRSWPTSWPET